jgi:hypothetical protein
LSNSDRELALVDRWIATARSNPISAFLILIALALGGIASTYKAYMDFKEAVRSKERVAVELLEPNPTQPRAAMVLIRNEGTETAVVQTLVFRINLKTRVGLKDGFGVLFPAGGAKAIGPGQSETLRFDPAASGMFPVAEKTNTEFVDFFAQLGKGTDVDPDVFRYGQMKKASCHVLVNVLFSSGTKVSQFPNATCDQVWPLLQAELKSG